MIFIEEIDAAHPERYLSAIAGLPPERREIIDKLVFLKDKVQSALAFTLLRKALKSLYGFHEVPPFSYNVNGKPFFKSFPEICFNLSHCDKAAACVIDNVEVGIDVECIRPFDLGLAQYICSERELREVSGSGNPAIAFTVLWTKKESFSKMKGEGLPEKKELRNLLEGVSQEMFSVTVKKEYVITVCRAPRFARFSATPTVLQASRHDRGNIF